MNDSKALVRAAAAGLVGVTVLAGPSVAAKKSKAGKQMAEVTKCYGVNSCSGKGKCGGAGHECAGQNSCKGQGWLLVPKESCLAIEGGSLEPKAAQPAAAPQTQEKK